MDYFGIVRDAWWLMRKQRPLWLLASFPALLAVLVTTLAMLLSALFAIMVTINASGIGDYLLASPLGLRVFDWFTHNERTVLLGGVLLAVLTVLLGVLDIAAQGGIVVETAQSLEGKRASVADGFASGFRNWWRSAALLALPALPGTLYVLAVSIVVHVTVTQRIRVAGQAPDFPALRGWMSALSPAGSVLGLLAMPLGVIAFIALRSALLEDQHWRSALTTAWALVRTRTRDCAMMFLAIFAVSLAVTFAGEFIVGAAAVPLAVVASIAASRGQVGGAILVSFAAVLLFVVLFAVIVTVTSLLTSVSWTLFWSRVTSMGTAERAGDDA